MTWVLKSFNRTSQELFLERLQDNSYNHAYVYVGERINDFAGLIGSKFSDDEVCKLQQNPNHGIITDQKILGTAIRWKIADEINSNSVKIEDMIMPILKVTDKELEGTWDTGYPEHAPSACEHVWVQKQLFLHGSTFTICSKCKKEPCT